jgi:hypothetical protein
VLYASLNTPTSPARSTWERFSHGFQLSSLLQAYSALPFNITSGVTTIQGTTGRPIVDGDFITRNAGIGSRFFTMSLRLSRVFAVRNGLSVEGLVEAFNVTNRTNNLARNGSFGSGAYPTNPSSTFGQILAVGDPRSIQVGLRVRF